MVNLYWLVYENIENEVLDITRSIHFCDEQINTYSTRLSDLLFRCCVEIESISKELFDDQFSVGDTFKIGKKRNIECKLFEDNEWRKQNKKGSWTIQQLYFDYNCINYLSNKWNLDERKIIVNCSNMFFKNLDNIEIAPLSKKELEFKHSVKENGGWLKTYQAIKHSRIKNQNLGSIYYMLRALAALYLLNIYYRYLSEDQVYFSNIQDFDLSCGSKIFTTTSGVSINDVFIEQYNGILELNIDQEVSYIKFDSNGYPIYLDNKLIQQEDGTFFEFNIPFTKKQEL